MFDVQVSGTELLVTKTTRLRFNDDVEYHYHDVIDHYIDDDILSVEKAEKLKKYLLTEKDKIEILESIKDEWENTNYEISKMMDIDTMYDLRDADIIKSGIKNWVRDNLI